jgi:hypothetical protein
MSPPPPAIESTNPAKNEANTRKRIVVSVISKSII